MAYTGPFAGGYTNHVTTSAIIVSNTSFSGNLVNAGKIQPGSGGGTGIRVENNSTITGTISNAGTISVGGDGVFVGASVSR